MMGFIEILFFVFLALKLMEQIDWSWWWVFSPFWIGYPLIIVVMVSFNLLARR